MSGLRASLEIFFKPRERGDCTGLLVKGILRLRLFFALIAQRTILAQDDRVW